jgi:disulfide bond formation protein DsbB
MIQNSHLFFQLVGIGIISMQAVAVLGLIAILNNKFNFLKFTVRISKQHVLIVQYGIAMAAMVGSLFISDAIGFLPCKLCWYQRIAMYPQAFIYLLALIKNDDSVADYGLLLSVVGFCLSLYHYLLQMKIITAGACSTTGFGVSCSDIYVKLFGYITIPMMSMSTFGLIIVVWVLYKRQSQKTKSLLKDVLH